MIRKSLLLTACLSAIGSALGSTSAAAQEGAVGTPSEAADAGQIGDIIVTAQRRSESAQKVPISLTALGEDLIETRGIVDTTSLNGQVPSLSIDTVGTGNLIYLRGVGTDNSSVNGEPSVATYIDGVYVYGGNGNIIPLFDVNRIEVLKGPQGTLFGRNATGGVIQVITKDPSFEPEFSGELGYANYDTITGHAYATAGLTENLAFNASVNYRHQGNGWGYNSVRNEDAFYSNFTAVRTKLLFTPGDDTRITVGFHYNHGKSSGFITQVPEGVIGPDGVVGDYDRFEYKAGAPTYNDYQNYLATGRIEHDFDFARLVSITGYYKLKFDFPSDADYTPASIVDAFAHIYAHSFSQELQLQSHDDTPIQWVAGLYYFKARAAYSPLFIAGAAVAPLPSLNQFQAQTTETGAAFAQASAELFPATKLTVGFRYTQEKLKKVGVRFESEGTVIATIPDQSDSRGVPTWRIALDHQFTNDIMGYASYTRGSKSGGYNINGLSTLPAYRPEKLDAYEVGLKTQLFDRHLRFNVAAFLYKFKNIQVVQEQGTGISLNNAAAATIKGFDVDFDARPFKNFTLSGAFGYVHGRFDDYPNAVAYPPSVFDGPSSNFDASGNELPYSGKFSGSLTASYDIPTSAGLFTLASTVVHQDRRYVGPDNRLFLPQYTTLDASLRWLEPDEKYGLKLWIMNIADTRYLAAALETGTGDGIVPSAPRTYGVTGIFKF